MVSIADQTPWHSHEDMGKYDSLFPLLPNFVAQYTIGQAPSPQIGIPDKDSLRLTEYIQASLVADFLQISLSHAQKKYPVENKQSRWLGMTDKINTIFDQGRRGFSWYISFGMETPKKAESLQDLSMHFFYRNVAAFDASKRLSELGYLCETATILRSALEQFALCAKLWELEENVDLRSISRKSSFLILKNHVPSVGELYGVLSKYAHFEYDHHTHFFAHSSPNGATIQRAPVLRAYATHLLFLTMSCIAAYVISVAPRQFASVPNSVLDLRQFIDDVNNYSDQICSILATDTVLASFDILLRKMVTE